ncbi:MAG TPA: hypothetical protein VFH49_13680 [Aquabacterium sp.]|nr:hypothetical protein [Aquabacterium sp.]
MSDHPIDDDVSFARGSSTHPLGKLDCKLPDILMHGRTVDLLRGIAAQEGVTLSELVRTTLEARAWGREHVEMMAMERVRRITGNIGG